MNPEQLSIFQGRFSPIQQQDIPCLAPFPIFTDKEKLQTNPPNILILGGDGTINLLANHFLELLQEGQIEILPTLYVIPGGTSNVVYHSALKLGHHQPLIETLFGKTKENPLILHPLALNKEVHSVTDIDFDSCSPILSYWLTKTKTLPLRRETSALLALQAIKQNPTKPSYDIYSGNSLYGKLTLANHPSSPTILHLQIPLDTPYDMLARTIIFYTAIGLNLPLLAKSVSKQEKKRQFTTKGQSARVAGDQRSLQTREHTIYRSPHQLKIISLTL